jgi:hypothetical protein
MLDVGRRNVEQKEREVKIESKEKSLRRKKSRI